VASSVSRLASVAAVFVGVGPLPERDVSEEEIDRRVAQLEVISEPSSDEEAVVLASCSGPDDCRAATPGALLSEDNTNVKLIMGADQAKNDACVSWKCTLCGLRGNVQFLCALEAPPRKTCSIVLVHVWKIPTRSRRFN
jgi:hypothetical protein